MPTPGVIPAFYMSPNSGSAFNTVSPPHNSHLERLSFPACIPNFHKGVFALTVSIPRGKNDSKEHIS
jgi:hypothetical protein